MLLHRGPDLSLCWSSQPLHVLYQVPGQRTGIPVKGALTSPGTLTPLTCSLSLPLLSPILPLNCPTFLPNPSFHWLLRKASLQAPHQGSRPSTCRPSLLLRPEVTPPWGSHPQGGHAIPWTTESGRCDRTPLSTLLLGKAETLPPASSTPPHPSSGAWEEIGK